ncbi:Uncharacterised protein [Mycobacteroides abscessus subsp. abscessus]|nr:Uncharacterised protein [Mycobacteroides abscessus subsp. abscessus]
MFDERLHQDGGRPGDRITQVVVGLLGELGHGHRGRGQLLTVQCRTEQHPQAAQLLIVDHIAQLDDALIDAPGVGDDHQE